MFVTRVPITIGTPQTIIMGDKIQINIKGKQSKTTNTTRSVAWLLIFHVWSRRGNGGSNFNKALLPSGAPFPIMPHSINIQNANIFSHLSSRMGPYVSLGFLLSDPNFSVTCSFKVLHETPNVYQEHHESLLYHLPINSCP